MNNHHTTEDPKNIRMTKQERSTLHARIMKHVGVPTTQVSPVKVHPSQWLSVSVFKPVFLALFLLMISTSGVLLYQERVITKNKEQAAHSEDQLNTLPYTPESIETKTAPTYTTEREKGYDSKQVEPVSTPMLMNAASTQITEPATVTSKKRIADTRLTGSILGQVKKMNATCIKTDRSASDPECQQIVAVLTIVATNKDTDEQYTIYSTEQGEIQDILPLGTYIITPENKEDGLLKPDEYTVTENSPYQIFLLYK